MARKLPPWLALFLFFQGIFALTASGWVFRAPDELEVYFQAESLVDRGSLAVPQTLAFERGRSVFFGKRSPSGDPYAPYGPLVAFLTLPHHLAGRAVASLAGIDRAASPVPWRIVVGALTALAGGTAGALAVAGFFRAARALGASERRATVLAVVLGLATVLWTESKTLFSEPFAAAALIWAAALLLEARADESRARLVGAAALLAVACLVKATNVVFAAPLALAPLAARRPRASLVLLGGVAFAGIVHASWNLHRFGSPFDLGYDWSETVAGPARLHGFGGSLPRGLSVLLLSPGKSLVVWAPAVALLAAPRWRALVCDRALAAGVLGALAAGIVVFAVYIFPEGGYCHGPRHLVPIVPLALLPSALGAAPSRRALALALVAGALVNIPAVGISYLEDQVWSKDGARDVYYELVRDPGEGLPRNRYRLAYLPQASLPRLAARSVERIARGEVEAPGTGLDLLPLQLARVRAVVGGGDVIPRALGPLVALAALGLAGLGAAAAGATLLRKENGAILQPRGS